MSTAPVGSASPGQRRLALFSLGLAFMVLALDNLMVTGAAPTIAGELRGLDLVSWLFTGYLLMWTVTGPLFGKLADVYGRRPILVVGLGFYVVGGLLATQAQTMEQVIACRLLQGIGAGSVQPVAYTASADLFPPAQRAKAQVVFSLVYLVASLVAPPLTGLLVGGVSWRAIFLVDVALGLAAGACVWLTLRERIKRRAHRLDVAGAAILMLGAGSLMLALAQASREGTWTAPAQLGLYALALVSAAAFLWVERRAAEPLMPLGLFGNRIILASCLVILAMGACLWSYNAFVPLLVQGVLGGDAFQAGLISLPINAGWLATNILAVPLLWRWGYRTTCLAGMAAMVVGFAVLALVGRDVPLAYGLVLLGMTVQGLGLGFVNTAAVVAVQNAVPWAERGTATSAQQFFRQIGPTVLISGFQAVLNAQLAGQLAARGVGIEQLAGTGGRVGQANALLAPELRASLPPALLDNMRGALEVSLHQTFWLIAAVALVGFLAAWLLPGGHPEEQAWREEAPGAARPAEARG